MLWLPPLLICERLAPWSTNSILPWDPNVQAGHQGVGATLGAKDSSGVIETGYNMDAKKKKTKYNHSELRLVETLEEVCGGMMDYRIHKERQDSTRWAKKMSQTFQTLHNLVNKGVKVELGIPMELWDDPSAEVAHLKTQCEGFVEDNEEAISAWYFGDQIVSLQATVCGAVVSRPQCLAEPYGEDVKAPAAPPAQGSAKGDAARSAKDREDL
ncbi:Protein canopy 4 [Chionoecetes opilio]|uniref:Protein canopy 4 n=1 Tax=Chionoecetes opilio TaxID=41210 RepID=A0A8J4YQU8_CHIOP|nr:Protein canopy 4 [Chionoecetes opilio]